MYIHFIAPDARQNAAAQALDRRFTTRSGAFSFEEDTPDAVILPIPTTRDGVHVTDTSLTLAELDAKLDSRTPVIGYGSAPALKTVNYCDLEKDERFVAVNAELTAECGTAILLNTLHERGLSLDGTVCVVLGYGRIARGMIRRLEPFGTHLLIGARRQSARTAISTLGHMAFDLTDRSFFAERGGLLFRDRPHILINTVPSPAVLDGLAEMPSPLFGLELSGKSDVMAACRALPYPMLNCRSLPTRYTSHAAGLALATAIRSVLDGYET